MDRQPVHGAVVIDKAQLPELIHEMADPRPGGAGHLSQGFPSDPGKDRLGPTFGSVTVPFETSSSRPRMLSLSDP